MKQKLLLSVLLVCVLETFLFWGIFCLIGNIAFRYRYSADFLNLVPIIFEFLLYGIPVIGSVFAVQKNAEQLSTGKQWAALALLGIAKGVFEAFIVNHFLKEEGFLVLTYLRAITFLVAGYVILLVMSVKPYLLKRKSRSASNNGN